MKKTMDRHETDKLSVILGIDKQVMATLWDNELLDVSKCRNILVKKDYKRILDEGKFCHNHIVGALVKEYGISRSSVELILYNKKVNKNRSCIQCGKTISKYKFVRYKGLCDTCLIEKININ